MSLFDELEKEMAVKDADATPTNQQAAVAAIQLLIVVACFCGIVLALAGTAALLMWWF